MEEITLKSFIMGFKKRKNELVKRRFNTPFWKIRTLLSLEKEIKRANTLIQAGERYMRHQVHQN